jgi:membrane-bound lytic murein transglycosylase A
VTRWRLTRLLAFLLLLILAGCVGGPPAPPKLTLVPARFSELPGWGEDRLGEALAAFNKSCGELAQRDDTAAVGSPPLRLTAADWRDACNAAAQTSPDDASARAFFERYFAPYLVGNNGETAGLFTGYYEPLLHGSRERGGVDQTPILKRPPDLVMVELGRFRPAWRGERIAGRVVDGNLVPYASRAEIERGALDPMHLDILWVDDPVAAFFLQVQGSGRVALRDGSMVRLGYDGQNGQTYVAIGRLLVARGELALDAVSLQSIRAWIKAHPKEGAALMDENPSYVFFREMNGDGPIGAEGVVLTPGRSLAVDRNFIPLGAPLFLATSDHDAALRRLVVAQDTGGAIGGPVRGDVFWGFGEEAEARAGVMRARGLYYLLLPKTVTPPLLALAP